jgi:predicted alpha/beta superfamily hydrolase
MTSALIASTVFMLAVQSAVAPTGASQAAGTQTATPAMPLVIGDTFTIASTVLGEERRINVYVPPGASGSSAVPLPVLYMPDGGMKEDFLHVAGLVQVSAGNGTMRPFILVGIENTERRRDMTGPTDLAEDRKIAVRVGGSAAFRRFIRTELMPRIKERYPTTAETAVMGESLAGLFVVETFFREPDLFDTYIAFDPSLWWNGGQLVKEAPRELRTARPAGKVLFLSNSGEPELAKLTGQLAAILEKRPAPGLTWHYVPMPDEQHATIYHPAALRALRLLFKPLAPK